MNTRKINRNRVSALIFAVAAAFLITSVVMRVISDTITAWTLATAMLAVADIAAVRHFWNRKPTREPTREPTPSIYGETPEALSQDDLAWLDEQANLAGITLKGRNKRDLHSWETTLGTPQPWENLMITRVRFFENADGAHAVITDANGEGTIINWHRRLGHKNPNPTTEWLNQLIRMWATKSHDMDAQ